MSNVFTGWEKSTETTSLLPKNPTAIDELHSVRVCVHASMRMWEWMRARQKVWLCPCVHTFVCVSVCGYACLILWVSLWYWVCVNIILVLSVWGFCMLECGREDWLSATHHVTEERRRKRRRLCYGMTATIKEYIKHTHTCIKHITTSHIPPDWHGFQGIPNQNMTTCHFHYAKTQ